MFTQKCRLSLIYASFVLFTLAVYIQTSSFDFVRLDDDVYVSENPHIAEGLTLDGLKWSLTADFFTDARHADYWQPVTFISRMIDITLFGMHAGGHHMMNVFIHITNVLLLFTFLRRGTSTLWRSAIVAVLFAVHPLQAEAVAWVTERKDLLAALFGFLALNAYLSYATNPSRRRFLAVLLLYALSLMSKPMWVTMPFILLLIDFWPLARFEDPLYSRRNLARLYEKLPFLGLAVFSCVVTLYGQSHALGRPHLFVTVLSIPVLYTRHLLHTIFPVGIAYWGNRIAYIPPVWQAAGSVIVLALLTVLFIKALRKAPHQAVGWLWFLIMLAPTVVLSDYGSRFMYVPLAGLLLITVWSAYEWLDRMPHPGRTGGLIAVLAVLLYGTAGWHQTRQWQNTYTLFEHALRHTTDNYLANLNLGFAHERDGRLNLALAYYESARRANPGYDKSYYNIATVLSRLDRKNEGKPYYEAALRLNPAMHEAHANLALLLTEQGQFEKAVTHYLIALKDSDNHEVHNNLGIAYQKLGRNKEAARQFETALSLVPAFPEAHNNLGNVLAEEGRSEDALTHFREALRINPEYADAHNSLGVLFSKTGDTASALVEFEQAVRLMPDSAQAHFNLALVLADRAEFDRAADLFSEAIRLAPENAKAHYHLGVVRTHMGQWQEAVEAFTAALRLVPDYESAGEGRRDALARANGSYAK